MAGRGGGASLKDPGLELESGRRGDCSRRKVRLLMELELEARRRFWGGGEEWPRVALRLGCDVIEA